MFLKLFLNVLIKKIKIHNILDIIEILNSMKSNKCIQIFYYENVYLSVSYDFLKFNGSRKIKV
jgi:hypothetical protein